MKSITLLVADFAKLEASSDAIIYQRMNFFCMNTRGLKLPRFDARCIGRSKDLITIHLYLIDPKSQSPKEVDRLCFASTPDLSHRPVML